MHLIDLINNDMKVNKTTNTWIVFNLHRMLTTLQMKGFEKIMQCNGPPGCGVTIKCLIFAWFVFVVPKNKNTSFHHLPAVKSKVILT